jgi:hypothetical protein
MAENCRREAATLIRSEVQKYCEQPPPLTQEELTRRQRQAMFLTSKIASIAHADSMARSHPGVSKKIVGATKAFCDRLGLDDNPFSQAMELTARISDLCHTELMQR